jgi:hypothetical protein
MHHNLPICSRSPLSPKVPMPLQFFDASLVGPTSKRELDEMREMVRADSPSFEFDPAYLQVVAEFNGGRPSTRYFHTRNGQLAPPIERFLHYTAGHDLKDHQLGFLNANVFWSALENRLGTLLPFAVLANNDALCFDCGSGESPVVLWSNERSVEDEPSYEHVADSFDDFCAALSSVAAE